MTAAINMNNIYFQIKTVLKLFFYYPLAIRKTKLYYPLVHMQSKVLYVFIYKFGDEACNVYIQSLLILIT